MKIFTKLIALLVIVTMVAACSTNNDSSKKEEKKEEQKEEKITKSIKIDENQAYAYIQHREDYDASKDSMGNALNRTAESNVFTKFFPELNNKLHGDYYHNDKITININSDDAATLKQKFDQSYQQSLEGVEYNDLGLVKGSSFLLFDVIESKDVITVQTATLWFIMNSDGLGVRYQNYNFSKKDGHLMSDEEIASLYNQTTQSLKAMTIENLPANGAYIDSSSFDDCPDYETPCYLLSLEDQVSTYYIDSNDNLYRIVKYVEPNTFRTDSYIFLKIQDTTNETK